MNALIKDRFTVYCQLMRIDKPIGTLLLLWPTLWALWIAADGLPPLSILAIFVAGTFLMRSAGCVINDYADREFDGLVERTSQRPFARKAVSTREALTLTVVLCLASLLLILPLNLLTLELSVGAAFLAVSYPFTKRFFPLPQAYLGIAFSFGIPMAFAAVRDTVPPVGWLMMLATWAWIFAYDTAYAMADKPDDLRIGIHTSAVTLGHHDVAGIMVCQAVFLALLAVVGRIAGLGLVWYAAIAVSAILIGRQYLQLRTRDRGLCFKVFLDNNQVGAALFAGLALHYLIAS
ncbi:4-hydroxybenzoate octaprenyltransferase [Paludibacterium paludis]|uniref:4-hydroxybenzoate octaprenyltransferase n=1 Tax=Paludibacterium paludis TaxID=1225769 RepID=A0A918P6Q9_9NEIS|nr:4-hydroxybenzoate octaprenyltransferase [Paludibacterium paludis]GGY27141.1 4-hydroxybenzoate octaprenyltransferase [Paludibacterium paludis]